MISTIINTVLSYPLSNSILQYFVGLLWNEEMIIKVKSNCCSGIIIRQNMKPKRSSNMTLLFIATITIHCFHWIVIVQSFQGMHQNLDTIQQQQHNRWLNVIRKERNNVISDSAPCKTMRWNHKSHHSLTRANPLFFHQKSIFSESDTSTFYTTLYATPIQLDNLHEEYEKNIDVKEEDFIIDEEDDFYDNDNVNMIMKNDNENIDDMMMKEKFICVTGIVKRSGPLNEAVMNVLGSNKQNVIKITLEQAGELIEIGAVWAKMERLTQQDVIDLYDNDKVNKKLNKKELTDSDSRALYADLNTMSFRQQDPDNNDLDNYIEEMDNQRYRRILSPTWITAGTDIRIYPYPRRYHNACQELSNNTNRLLYEDTTFLVVDKPPMLPTQPDSSNYYECCPGCINGPFYDINNEIISNRPYICHRVDSCVGGVVVLSKTTLGQKVFHQYQRNRQLRKTYNAVTTNPVPLGIHIHWMWAQQSIRGKIRGPPCQLISHQTPESRRIAKEFWKRCILEVTDCKPITISSNIINSDNNQHQYYQSTIRLVTGRKHQVRAQLASLNCPILHDTLYEPIAGLTLDKLDDVTTEDENELDIALLKCRVPNQPIGLQASGIVFGNIRVKALPPWWSK